MSNVIRGDEFVKADEVIEIPLHLGFTPDREISFERRRIDIHERLLKEAKEKTKNALEEEKSILEKAKKESEETISRAKKEAAAIVQDAKNERDKIEKEARELGRNKALEEARKECTAKIAELAGILETTAANLEKTRGEYLRASLDAMLQIISVCLRKIFRSNVEADSLFIKRTLSAAIEEVLGADKITIRIHPADLEKAEEMKDEILQKVKGLSEIKFEMDSGITRGGTIIETSFGRVDARLESQLDEMLRELRITAEKS